MGRAERRMAAVLLVSLAPVLTAQSAPAGPRHTVTLVEAIRLSQAVQPSMVQAQGTVLNADARRRAAVGGFLPNLTASGSRSQFYSEGARVDPVSGQLVQSGSTNGSLNGSISTSIDLFNGFRNVRDLQSANANQLAAQASLVNAGFQQSLSTTNAFFDALGAGQLLRVRAASVRRAEEQLKVSVSRLRAGAATRSDSLRSLVNLGNSRLQLISAQNQLANAEANLGRLIGQTEPVSATDDSTYYRMASVVDSVGLRVEALANSPTVKSAEAALSAARAQLSSARAAYYPTLTLSGSASRNGSRSQDYKLLAQNNLQLGVSWNLFNRFQREQQIVTQKVNLENADATAGEARRQLVASLTARLADLRAAEARIEITRASVEASTEDLRVQQERYRLGVATIVDVLLVQESLAQAEVDSVTARFDYLRARAQIETLIGRSL